MLYLKICFVISEENSHTNKSPSPSLLFKECIIKGITSSGFNDESEASSIVPIRLFVNELNNTSSLIIISEEDVDDSDVDVIMCIFVNIKPSMHGATK